MTVRIPNEAEMDWLTRRAVAEIIPYGEFVKALKSGKALRLKMGFDPSAPDLTIGHAVGLRKLRQLQEFGHTVVIIVGDWTAQIGDPSGQSKTRPMLTAEQVKENAETYLRQFFKIVDRDRCEVRWQSEWFGKFGLSEVVRLAAKFTVAQMLERADFAERFSAQKPVGVHELLYPMLQGYDSVAVQSDVEFGGTDQKFNLMVGRELQSEAGQAPQIVFTVPLLVGTDGVKMSKSMGNYIAVEESPSEMYGKVMSIPDPMIAEYMEYVTDVADQDVAEVRRVVEERTGNPRDAKMRLAREIVTQFHDAGAAVEAEEQFVRTFSKRELPEDLPIREVSFSTLTSEDSANGDGVRLPWLLTHLEMTASASEANRLIKQRAVEIDGEVVEGARAPLRDGMVIRVGKHRFLRVVDADGGPC
ncbi:MAG: tyrosine--tRNA ligase [Dehalococcoidia bacterium]